MRVLLIRHATSQDGEVLSSDGVEETRVLAAHLSRLQVVPSVILTSSSGDARHTGTILRTEVRLPEVPAHVLRALTAPLPLARSTDASSSALLAAGSH